MAGERDLRASSATPAASADMPPDDQDAIQGIDFVPARIDAFAAGEAAPSRLEACMRSACMRWHLPLVYVVLATVAGLACGSSGDAPTRRSQHTTTSEALPFDAVAPAAKGPAGTGTNTGLPCDVQAVLENRCIGCHDGTQQLSLLSYANLTAPSKTDPTKSLALVAVERMTGWAE